MSHAGKFAPDGKTFYGASWGIPVPKETPDPSLPPLSGVHAIDMTDPATPRGITSWIPENPAWKTHSAITNNDGTRVYVSLMRYEDDHEKSASPNGIVILDSRDIQARRPNAQFRVISTLFWDDVHLVQLVRPITVNGRSYLVVTDIAGALGNSEKAPPPDACKSGRPGHGFPRIIDISDENNPRTVSKLMMEVAAPENCEKVRHDPTVFGAYGVFGCNPDNEENAKLIVCGHVESGARVFDVRDPANPREVGYFKPRARRTEARFGSIFPTFLDTGPQTGAFKDHTADPVINALFRNNGSEIWIQSTDNAFQVLRFTDHFKASRPDLFPK